MYYQVQKNIPIPFKKPSHGKSGITQALRKLEITDSILFDVPPDYSFHNFANRLGIKIIQRREENKTRVWRTE